MPRGSKVTPYDQSGILSLEEDRLIRMEIKTKMKLLRTRPGDSMLEMQLTNLRSEIARDKEVRRESKPTSTDW